MIDVLTAQIIACAIGVIGFAAVMFSVARVIGRYDLVDAVWGWLFIIAAVASYAMQSGNVMTFDVQTAVTLLVVIWGVRLSTHILRRISSTSEEDPRYVELRKKWRGNVMLNIFLRVYVLQAVLALIIVAPVLAINLRGDGMWSVLAVVGIAIWIVGFICESIADKQLARFISKSTNKGKIMQSGLWRYSRHPNYFGELTQWWGIFVVALTVPGGWVTFFGPLLLSYLIIFVSGVALSEKRFEGRPGWGAYQKRTSVLLPLPPKRV